MENSVEVSRRITKGEVVASAIRPPFQLVDTTVTLAALLGDKETRISERLASIQLEMQLQQATPPEETLPTVNHLTLTYLPAKKAVRVWSMIDQLDSMSDGTLGEINTVNQHIDLGPNGTAEMSRPHRAGANARKEIYRKFQRMQEQDVIDTDEV